MVSGIVSRYTAGFTGSGAADRGITGGPLYPVPEVVALLANNRIVAWTTRCAADIQKMELDGDGVSSLLHEALLSGCFAGSEWCQQQPSGPWAACDAYKLTRMESLANKRLAVEYYLKFAIGKTGAILLLVSCHLSS